MPKLINRQKQIPFGYKFYLPITKWQATSGSSIDRIAGDLLNHLKGNPVAAQKLGWPLELGFMEKQVEEFNAKLCQQMGWTDYYVADGGATPSVPFLAPKQEDQNKISVAAASIKKIWSGMRVGHEWLDSGEPAVPSEQSTQRASVCVNCKQNTPGDFTAWFTKPASEGIRRQLEKVEERKLSTPYDSQLNVCSVCLCPMKLKVHTPVKFIKNNLSAEVMNDLRAVRIDKSNQPMTCWVVKEVDA